MVLLIRRISKLIGKKGFCSWAVETDFDKAFIEVQNEEIEVLGTIVAVRVNLRLRGTRILKQVERPSFYLHPTSDSGRL